MQCLIESRTLYNAMLSMVKAQYEEKGTFPVNPRFTTQACSNCGTLIQQSLSVRTHICTSCDFVADRDVNAAQNILVKARAWPSGMAPDGEPVELRSPQL